MVGFFSNHTIALMVGLAMYYVLADTTPQKKSSSEYERRDSILDNDISMNQAFNSTHVNSSVTQPDFKLTNIFRKKSKIDDGLTRFNIPLKYAKGSAWGMVGEMRVGYEGKKTFDVMFDTQSSNMLMFDKGIRSSSQYSKRIFNRFINFYNYKTSLEAHGDVAQFEIKYPDGSVYGGGRVHDSVWLGRGSSHMFYMMFAWVDYMNQAAADTRGGKMSGIVGLGSPGFVKHQGTKHKGFFGMLVNANCEGKRKEKQKPFLKKNPLFAFYVSKTGKTGELMMGGHNEALLAEGHKMVYFPALRMYTSYEEVVKEDWEILENSSSTGDEMSQSSNDDAINPYETRDVVIVDGRGGGGQGRRQRRHGKTSLLRAAVKNGENDRKGSSVDVVMGEIDRKRSVDVVWGVRLNRLTIGSEMFAEKANALFCSTLPYGVGVPSLDYLRRITDYIDNGATLTPEGEIVIGCDQLESNSLPVLTLTIQEHEFEFTPKEYFAEVVTAKESSSWAAAWWKKMIKRKKEEDKICRSFFGVSPGWGVEGPREDDDDEGAVTIKLGIPFMKKYYTEYDYGVGDKASRIGIALSKGVEIKKRKFVSTAAVLGGSSSTTM